MIYELAMSTLRLSIPILFAAYGGMLSERSGIANIALEANLMMSAFVGATVTTASGHLLIGASCGILASGLLSLAFGVSCIWGRGDNIVVGTAFNLLAVGLIPVVTKALFNVTGSTPSIAADQTFHSIWPFVVLAVLVLIGFEYLFRCTRHGLRILAAGENPAALFTQGVNHRLVRLRAVVEGGLVIGCGGIYLSLCQGSSYQREMSAGRGFIALAALIFGAWKPVPTFLACLFFAFTDAIQIQLQGKQIGTMTIPNQFVQILPYAITLLVLVSYSRQISAPTAINRRDD